MKNTIADIFLKGILVILVETLVIVSPSYYAFSLPPSAGEGIILMLLFMIYPLLSIFLGILTFKLKIKSWVNAAIIAIAFFGLFAILYNFTAYSYIPIYLVLYIVGLTLTKKLSKKNTVEI
ncbi:hypothetical protein [Desulfosporosinus sp. FKA]|uniref:hypothetical protein n=1 Tax=Desulfosporosinus sp. FKA TaxID=1969834 RepID=UPI000B498630|nr:hypothetical protein [Desulfosporosinus sp. FKA]